jgi:hypothetical protein
VALYDQPFHVTPALPVEAYRTFRIHSPRDIAVRSACGPGCAGYDRGWETKVDESEPLGQFQAAYIRESSGRTFREMKTADGLTVFRFEPHQRCFADHMTLPERFIVRDGDWRGNPTGRQRVHVRAADWVEDCGLNLQAWKQATERG